MSVPPRIALIDDDQTWLETLAECLQDKGFQVRTAQGGTSGLALLQEGSIALAVVDFHMPEMSGLELLRRLRRLRLHVAVLMLSSDDDPTLPVRAQAEGASAFLSKTMKPGDLLRSLVESLLTVDATLHQPGIHPWDRFLPAPRRPGWWLPTILPKRDPKRN